MQSAAKCPFLLTFQCIKYCGPDEDFKIKKKQQKKSNEQFFDEDDDPEINQNESLNHKSIPVMDFGNMSRLGKSGIALNMTNGIYK